MYGLEYSKFRWRLFENPMQSCVCEDRVKLLPACWRLLGEMPQGIELILN